MRELFTNKLRATITSSMKTNMASFVIFQRPSHDPASFSGWDDPVIHNFTLSTHRSRISRGRSAEAPCNNRTILTVPPALTAAHSRSQAGSSQPTGKQYW